MGASILIGSFIGSFGANALEEHTVNVVYAALATIAAIMMFVPKRNNGDEVKYNKWLASLLAFCRRSIRHYRCWRLVPFSSDYASYFKIADTYNDSNIYRYYVYFFSRDYNWKSNNWTSSCNSSSYYCDCKYLCSAAWSAVGKRSIKSTAIYVIDFDCRYSY